jgi:retron-type reverse transcriptase
VRRIDIPKPGQPGKTRPLAVKLAIEPLFEADFMPRSFGFRPKRTPRMALGATVQSVNDSWKSVPRVLAGSLLL